MTGIKQSLYVSDRGSNVGTTDLAKDIGNFANTGGCIVLLVQSGCAAVTVNSRRRALRRGDMLILFYDDAMMVNDRSALFSARFVALDYKHVEDTVCRLAASDFWDLHYYECPVYHASHEQWLLLDGWWRQMEWIDGIGDAARRDELLKNGFLTFMSAIDCTLAEFRQKPLPDTRSRKLVVDFYKLLSEHCKQRRDVGFYADRLCITTTYLYKVCRKVLGVSPKEEIDRLTVFEIKSRLANTDMPIKRIAEELHFEDASYMCRYFRRYTGISPVNYRCGQSAL